MNLQVDDNIVLKQLELIDAPDIFTAIDTQPFSAKSTKYKTNLTVKKSDVDSHKIIVYLANDYQ